MINICIIDDELLALQLLENYVNKTEGLNLSGKFRNPIEALDEIKKNPVDLLFIDIEMPQLKGIDLVKQLNFDGAVVFCTAYSEYAADAYNLDAVDYLVKPVSYERFLKSIEKVKEYLFVRRNIGGYNEAPVVKEEQYITIKADHKLVKIDIKDILYIEGLAEYIKIVCKETKYITFERMKKMEELLPSTDFKRVHKSYIISLENIKCVEGYNIEMKNGHIIPLSRDKKEEIRKHLLK
jgi:DNA-binding LytR/AlgR family response regulator